MQMLKFLQNISFVFLLIRECGSTLYVRLMGIVRMLIQKFTGIVHHFIFLFFYS